MALILFFLVAVSLNLAASKPNFAGGSKPSNEWIDDGMLQLENYARGVEDVEEQTETVDEQDSEPEIQNYDTAVAQPHCIKICVGRGRLGGCLGWSCAWSYSSNEETPLAVVLGSEAEVSLYHSREDRKKLHAMSVVRATLYERPLADDVPEKVSSALDGKQKGVVVTLSDGRRFLLVKGNQLGRGRRTVAIIFDHMSDDWVKMETKEVKSSTFGDFFHAGGKSFDLITDNGNHAAARMMQLP